MNYNCDYKSLIKYRVVTVIKRYKGYNILNVTHFHYGCQLRLTVKSLSANSIYCK